MSQTCSDSKAPHGKTSQLHEHQVFNDSDLITFRSLQSAIFVCFAHTDYVGTESLLLHLSELLEPVGITHRERSVSRVDSNQWLCFNWAAITSLTLATGS
jgi:hypothetical protein